MRSSNHGIRGRRPEKTLMIICLKSSTGRAAPLLPKPVVWAWQARFMAEGVAGLLRDKTRKPGKAPLPPSAVERLIDLALTPAPGETTHWTGRMLATAAGVSLRSVLRN